MKNIFLIIVCFLLVASGGYAIDIPYEPDKTLLSTAVGTVNLVDSFLVSASPGGLSVYLYNDSLQQFDFIKRTFLDIDTVVAHQFDTMLIVDTRDGQLHFLSLNHLPELPYLGSFSIQTPIADYVYYNEHLYLSAYFEGILRYDVSDLLNPLFVDSSMVGVLLTELDIDGQYLYALDEYNGLLRYELTPTGFGDFIDYLFVPFRAFDFAKIDSLFFLSITGGGVLVGDFNQPAGSNIVDSIKNITQIEKILFTDSLYLFIGQREMTVVERLDNSNQMTYDISENNPIGDIFEPDSSQFLILADLDHGITLFDIQHDLASFEGLSYSGFIQDMYIYDKQIYVSSSKEAVTTYSSDTSSYGEYQYSVYEHLTNTGQMQNNGDSLFVLYPDFEKLTLLINSDEPDSVLLENSITISAAPVKDMKYYPTQIYDNALLMIQHPFGVEVFTVSDSGYILPAPDWNFVADITTLAVKGTTAFVTDAKNECQILHINEFFEKELITSIGMSESATASAVKGDFLYVFQENEIYIFDISNPAATAIDTVISLPYPVVDAVLVGEHLFGVGYEGISVFDLSGTIPEMIASGGMSGDRITADSNFVTITDGSHVHMYRYDIPVFSNPDDIHDDETGEHQMLSQNYPNPFNLETAISFNLPGQAHVELYIFNILGQQVVKLVDELKDSGRHTVFWDGKNSSGKVVSSGMYLYKLVTKENIETRKMILLK